MRRYAESGELGDLELTRFVIPDGVLGAIESALGSERAELARLVVYLGEVEERLIHLVQGYASLFEFYTVQLRLSEGEAFRRINAARLARRFPVIVELLAAGDQHLSGLVLLRDHLTEDNHAELLAEASNKSKRQIEMLLAARLPSRTSHRHAANLMSHANPSRDLAVIVERAIDLLIDKLETAVLAKKKTSRVGKSRPAKDLGAVPRAERRTVFERDGTRCTYVGPDGRRCTSRAFLQIDHIEERARGGFGKSKNLRVRCAAHNRIEAERSFGREHVERCIHFFRQKRRASLVAGWCRGARRSKSCLSPRCRCYRSDPPSIILDAIARFGRLTHVS